MQQHGVKYFAHRLLSIPLTLGLGSEGQNKTYSEHGRVAYQIKEKYKCGNTEANILSQTTPSQPAANPGDGDYWSKFTFKIFKTLPFCISY